MEGIFQIIDANLNRATEGLRVVEEVARFVIKDELLSKEIKERRHKLSAIFKGYELIKFRNTSKDLGKYADFDDTAYRNLQEQVHRNFKRVEEGCRVIEEFSKLVSPEIAPKVKEIRFSIYEIEKVFSERFKNSLTKGQMVDFRLYVIVDEKYINRSLSAIVTEVCEGGATVIQIREKNKETKEFIEDAIVIRELTSNYKVTFIVNDRVDVALTSKADGVHLGRFDMPLPYARQFFNGIIGKSVVSVEEAIEAQREGASYLGVGSLFPSPTKPKPTIGLAVITEIKKAVKIPVIGIGGITLNRVKDVLSAGADGVCVSSDIFNYPDLRARVGEFKSEIQEFKRLEVEKNES